MFYDSWFKINYLTGRKLWDNGKHHYIDVLLWWLWVTTSVDSLMHVLHRCSNCAINSWNHVSSTIDMLLWWLWVTTCVYGIMHVLHWGSNCAINSRNHAIWFGSARKWFGIKSVNTMCEKHYYPISFALILFEWWVKEGAIQFFGHLGWVGLVVKLTYMRQLQLFLFSIIAVEMIS